MGWLRKKQDPLSDRKQLLRAEIERLEEEIRGLAEAAAGPSPKGETSVSRPASPAPAPSAPAQTPSIPTPTPETPAAARENSVQPRLRSTMLPNGQTVSRSGAAPAPRARAEPLFEKVDHQRLSSPPEAINKAMYNELGIRKYDLPSAWQRLRQYFHGTGPQHSNFVRYLAAGNIQGLRPLRYEKQVARRRFIILLLALFVALWGVIAMFLRHW